MSQLKDIEVEPVRPEKGGGGNGYDTTHEKLDLIIEVLSEMGERLEDIQRKVEEIDLSYGPGVTIEGYES